MINKFSSLINIVLSKLELSQGYEAEENNKIVGLIESAFIYTLNTVKFSSNLTPSTPFNVISDSADRAILVPVDYQISAKWSFFILNRTVSHTLFNDKYLVTTYKKLPGNKNWLPVLKIVDIQMHVYFEDIKKQNLFLELELNYHNFVKNNIQARNERSGNCNILTQTLFYFLWNRAIKSHDNLINRIEIMNFKSLDHCFVMINRDFDSLLSDYTTWQGWIIDPWRGVNGKTTVLPGDDFFSYCAQLRNSRPDIICPAPPSLDIEVTLSITDINLPENIILFNELDELIHHGKMELIAEKDLCSQIDINTHKIRFFSFKEEIESLDQVELQASI
ncbi:MAG: hypothetical protein Q8M03_09125 [Legionella sp.]|nr:hypothetical protein [Legionella sp.]